MVDYTYFKPSVDASAFEMPAICSNASVEATKSRFRSFPTQMKAHLPYVHFREPLLLCTVACGR